MKNFPPGQLLLPHLLEFFPGLFGAFLEFLPLVDPLFVGFVQGFLYIFMIFSHVSTSIFLPAILPLRTAFWK